MLVSLRALRLAVFVVFTLCSFAAADEGFAAPGVAKVGNMVITQADVDQRTQKLMPMQLGFHNRMDEEKLARIKKDALNELIERAYKVQYAIDDEISVDAASFEQEWQKLLTKNKNLKDPAASAMASTVRADLYLDHLANSAEKKAVDEKIRVSDQEVKEYYAQNKEIYFRPKLYTVSHVFVKVDPSSNDEEKKERLVRAEELYKRAISGEDFYNLAYYESDDRSKYVGGSLGSFHAGQTISEFDKVIKEMKPGDIVGPVKTRFGYHVVKLDDIAEEKQLDFDEVASTIRANLKAEMRAELYKKWLEDLKKRYPLEIHN